MTSPDPFGAATDPAFHATKPFALRHWLASIAAFSEPFGLTLVLPMVARMERGLGCPDCSRRLPWIRIRFGESFDCPACGASLCVPNSYVKWLSHYNVRLTGLLAYGLGARGWAVLIAVLLGFFPMAMALGAIARRVQPPKLTFSDDYLTHLKDVD